MTKIGGAATHETRTKQLVQFVAAQNGTRHGGNASCFRIFPDRAKSLLKNCDSICDCVSKRRVLLLPSVGRSLSMKESVLVTSRSQMKESRSLKRAWR